MQKLEIHTFNLPLADTFRITHEARDQQPTVVVGLRAGDHTGWGEAAAVPYYGQSTEKMIRVLETHRDLIERTPLITPEAYWATLAEKLGDHPFELCALDIAANDLYGKQKGRPLYQLWGYDPAQAPVTNYTIGMADIDEMVRKLKARPWPLYKIKLGADHHLEVIRALRQHTDSPFRVDANTGWTAAQTIALAPELKALGVEFIEQPLKANDREGQKEVYAQSVLPVIADESCQTEADVAPCAGYFHGINIKLVKCGGLTPARRMIAEAKTLGLKVMVGCMTESSIGISAIAHIAPLLDYVDMDGALLLSKDIATGVHFTDDGKVHFPDRPGTGAELKPELR